MSIPNWIQLVAADKKELLNELMSAIDDIGGLDAAHAALLEYEGLGIAKVAAESEEDELLVNLAQTAAERDEQKRKDESKKKAEEEAKAKAEADAKAKAAEEAKASKGKGKEKGKGKKEEKKPEPKKEPAKEAPKVEAPVAPKEIPPAQKSQKSHKILTLLTLLGLLGAGETLKPFHQMYKAPKDFAKAVAQQALNTGMGEEVLNWMERQQERGERQHKKNLPKVHLPANAEEAPFVPTEETKQVEEGLPPTPPIEERVKQVHDELGIPEPTEMKGPPSTPASTGPWSLSQRAFDWSIYTDEKEAEKVYNKEKQRHQDMIDKLQSKYDRRSAVFEKDKSKINRANWSNWERALKEEKEGIDQYQAALDNFITNSEAAYKQAHGL